MHLKNALQKQGILAIKVNRRSTKGKKNGTGYDEKTAD
jgi:hypothetical protein